MSPANLPRFCLTLAGCVLIGATAAAQAPATQTETTRGTATVTSEQVSGEVVQVEGNNLLVELTSGEMQTFNVPEGRKFVIDGKDLSVRDLRPGTTLTATVKTTTTPVTVRTKSVLNGKVWWVKAPNVILTLSTGENKQYKVDDDVKFTIGGKPATVFDLRQGMVISAEKIVEAPDVEITTTTTVVGRAPSATPAVAQSTLPSTSPASTGSAPATSAAATNAAATSASATSAAETEASATTESEGSSSWMVWTGSIVLILVALAFLFASRKTAAK